MANEPPRNTREAAYGRPCRRQGHAVQIEVETLAPLLGWDGARAQRRDLLRALPRAAGFVDAEDFLGCECPVVKVELIDASGPIAVGRAQ